jgi:tetratricopeptide (TPR) repeat protein
MSMATHEEVLQQAIAQHRIGHLDNAEVLYRRLLGVDPRNADALHLLGVVDDARGNYARAALLIGQALAIRESPRFRCNLGMVRLHLGQAAAAEAECARALAQRPDYPEALNNRGAALDALGRTAEAAEAFRRTVQLRPDHAEAWCNLGNMLRLLRRPADAEAAHRQAILLLSNGKDTPMRLESHVSLATAFRQLGRLDEAEDACRCALELRPDHPDGLETLGNILRDAGRAEEAEAVHRKVVAQRPGMPRGYNDLAITLIDQVRLDEARAVLDLAKALDPADAETRHHRAAVLLAQGRFDDGWAEYEARFDTKQGIADKRHFAAPRWDGDALHGRTVLLHAEQGFGDVIQFCRYVPLVAAAGGRIVLEGPASLRQLLERLPGVAHYVETGEALPEFDCHCPLLSLPHAFKTDTATIPASVPYLTPPPRIAARWRQRFRAARAKGAKRHVGIIWAGNPHHANDRRRSLPFDMLAPLWDLSEIHWYSLQVGDRAADLADASSQAVTDLAPRLKDFSDTAAALMQLDGLVSVDTAAAHLAGALGIPTLLLLPYSSDWRWMQAGERSHWYPSLQLIRQDRTCDWRLVIQTAAARLDMFPARAGA